MGFTLVEEEQRSGLKSSQRGPSRFSEFCQIIGRTKEKKD
jgi:hypothetical protein